MASASRKVEVTSNIVRPDSEASIDVAVAKKEVAQVISRASAPTTWESRRVARTAGSASRAGRSPGNLTGSSCHECPGIPILFDAMTCYTTPLTSTHEDDRDHCR